jgi:hypothetical protein
MPHMRQIDARDFTAIPRLRESILSLPKDVAVCSVHGQGVAISKNEWLVNQGSSARSRKRHGLAVALRTWIKSSLMGTETEIVDME